MEAEYNIAGPFFLMGGKVMVRVFFAFYDFWVGIFYDRKKKVVYVGLLPTIMIAFHVNTTIKTERGIGNDYNASTGSSSSSPATTSTTTP